VRKVVFPSHQVVDISFTLSLDKLCCAIKEKDTQFHNWEVKNFIRNALKNQSRPRYIFDSLLISIPINVNKTSSFYKTLKFGYPDAPACTITEGESFTNVCKLSFAGDINTTSHHPVWDFVESTNSSKFACPTILALAVILGLDSQCGGVIEDVIALGLHIISEKFSAEAKGTEFWRQHVLSLSKIRSNEGIACWTSLGKLFDVAKTKLRISQLFEFPILQKPSISLENAPTEFRKGHPHLFLAIEIFKARATDVKSCPYTILRDRVSNCLLSELEMVQKIFDTSVNDEGYQGYFFHGKKEISKEEWQVGRRYYDKGFTRDEAFLLQHDLCNVRGEGWRRSNAENMQSIKFLLQARNPENFDWLDQKVSRNWGELKWPEGVLGFLADMGRELQLKNGHRWLQPDPKPVKKPARSGKKKSPAGDPLVVAPPAGAPPAGAPPAGDRLVVAPPAGATPAGDPLVVAPPAGAPPAGDPLVVAPPAAAPLVGAKTNPKKRKSTDFVLVEAADGLSANVDRRCRKARVAYNAAK